METIIEEYIALDYINEEIFFLNNSWAKPAIELPNANPEIRAMNKDFMIQDTYNDFKVNSKFIDKLIYNERHFSNRMMRAMEDERKHSEGFNLMQIHQFYNTKKDLFEFQKGVDFKLAKIKKRMEESSQSHSPSRSNISFFQKLKSEDKQKLLDKLATIPGLK